MRSCRRGATLESSCPQRRRQRGRSSCTSSRSARASTGGWAASRRCSPAEGRRRAHLAGPLRAGRRAARADQRHRRLGHPPRLRGRGDLAERSSRSRSTSRRCSSRTAASWRRCAQALEASGLAAKRLELEITEGLLLSDAEIDHAPARRAEGARREDRHGRFRHRLFEPQLSVALPLRQAEDRPVLPCALSAARTSISPR